jgi:hypothetical protein
MPLHEGTGEVREYDNGTWSSERARSESTCSW